MLKKLKKLYAIADFETCQRNYIGIFDFAQAFFNGGGQILQYRDKISTPQQYLENFQKLLALGQSFDSTLLIANEYLHFLEKNQNTTNYPMPYGIHLGQEDLSQIIKEKAMREEGSHKKGLPTAAVYGFSTHSLIEIEQTLALLPKDASEKSVAFFENPETSTNIYLGIGRVFQSATKNSAPQIQFSEEIIRIIDKIPHVFIGGVTIDNFLSLPRNELSFYAVIGDFFRAGKLPQDIENYTVDFLKKMG